jgi:hypothetical protein
MAAESRYVRKTNQETVLLDDEWMIMDTDGFTITKLNEVGGFCWSLLGEAQSVGSLSEAIRQTYESTDETVAEEVEAFLSELLQCGLVQHAS